MKESKLEKDFVEWVESQGGLTIKGPASLYVGIPDRIVIHKGRVAFVELKVGSRKPKPLQKWWIDVLLSHGAPAMWFNDDFFYGQLKYTKLEDLWKKDN